MDSNDSPVSPRRSSRAKASPIRVVVSTPSPRTPVLVHELTDERLGVRNAQDLHTVRLMAERPKDQHDLDPLDPTALLDRGAPFGEDPLDIRAPAVFEPLGRVLAVLPNEGVGDGVNEFRVRCPVMLPTGKNRSGPSRRLSLRAPAGTPSVRSARLTMAGRGQRPRRAVRRESAGPGGLGPRETRVDRTPPPPGHALAGVPVRSTPPAERRTETKWGGAARTERPRPPGEASTTGAAQRALALEPGCFRYAYRIGHAARRRDVARSLENRMETSTLVPQTREASALSLRTPRICGQTRLDDEDGVIL